MGSLWQTITRASGHQSGTYDGEALNAFSGLDDSEAIWYAFVHFGICLHSFIMVRYQHTRICEEKVTVLRQRKKAPSTYLFTALDDIKGANEGVCQTAGENASDHALSIVGHIVNVAHRVFYLV